MITQLNSNWVGMKKDNTIKGRCSSSALSLSWSVQGKERAKRIRIGIPASIAKSCGFIDGDKMCAYLNAYEGKIKVVRDQDGYLLRNEGETAQSRLSCCFPMTDEQVEIIFPENIKHYNPSFSVQIGQIMLDIGRGKAQVKSGNK